MVPKLNTKTKKETSSYAKQRKICVARTQVLQQNLFLVSNTKSVTAIRVIKQITYNTIVTDKIFADSSN